MSADPRTCRCGHEVDAHEHFRRGTECAVCGPAVCARFSEADAPSWLSRLTARWHRHPVGGVVSHPAARRRGAKPSEPGGGDHAREA